jgi:hypothetical protein
VTRVFTDEKNIPILNQLVAKNPDVKTRKLRKEKVEGVYSERRKP